MLHVILMILKIIGCILAALILLLLFLLLILLFVPVRYRAVAGKGETVFAEAKVTWLLRILSVPVSFRDGELSVRIKIFGITVKDLFAQKEREESEYELPAPPVTEAQEAFPLREKEEPVPEKEIIPYNDPFVNEETPSGDEKISKIGEIWKNISEIFTKIRNLKYTFQRLCGRIRQADGKVRDMRGFLQDERTKETLSLVLSQIRVLLRRLLPRKLRGQVRFGMPDPALTGEILGGISIFYPIFMDNVKVTPDFENACLEGELFIKGHFRLITLALIAIKLLTNKNFWFIYRKIAG